MYPIHSIVIDSQDCGDTLLVMPNVFSPDDDGVNDTWHLVHNKLIEADISIYNRWGILICKMDRINMEWAGRTTSGAEAPDGTYYCIIKGKFSTGINVVRKGFITLVR